MSLSTINAGQFQDTNELNRKSQVEEHPTILLDVTEDIDSF